MTDTDRETVLALTMLTGVVVTLWIWLTAAGIAEAIR